MWSKMKKHKLSMWRKVGKEIKIKINGKEYELKEDRVLSARMALACKARPEINIKDAIGMHEFSIVPRSLFAADGTMFHCINKSMLMSILEALPENQAEPASTQSSSAEVNQLRVDIVDSMAEVQSFKKTDGIKDCAQLADHFTSKLF